MSAAGSASPTTAAPDGAAVVWAFDPWREHPRRSAAAALGAVALCALVLALRLPFLLAVAMCLACLASLAPALARTECRLDADGAARRGPLGWSRRRWADVRRLEPVAGGVLVSPHAAPHWLDVPRALLLPADPVRRPVLLAAARRFRNAHAG